MIKLCSIALIVLSAISGFSQEKKPFRIGIAGLTHTHVHWLLGRAQDGDIEIVGIVMEIFEAAKESSTLGKMAL